MAKSKHVLSLAAAVATAISASASADTVQIISSDGMVKLTGELMDFDGQNYKLGTSIGVLQIAAAGTQCIGEPCAAYSPEPLTVQLVASSSVMSDIMPNILEAYSGGAYSMNGGFAVIGETEMSLEENDEAAAYQKLTNTATILLAERPISPRGLAELRAAGVDFERNPDDRSVVALDGVVAVVPETSPIRAITEANLARILSGRVRNWSEIGGPDAPIKVVTTHEDGPTVAVIDEKILAPNQEDLRSDASIVDTETEVVAAVRLDPNAIGLTRFSASKGVRNLSIKGSCGIQTPANAFTVKTEEYPLALRIFAYQNNNIGHVEQGDLFKFLSSDTAQQGVRLAGYVDQTVDSLSSNEQGLRFISSMLPSNDEVDIEKVQVMATELISADRLSLTFRFEEGSSRLDQRAEGDLARLADMARSGAFENKELIFMGFSDAIGPNDLNELLSQSRAESVRGALLSQLDREVAAGLQTEIRGLGEMSPLGCNELASGRKINRRVEIWTKDIVE